MDNTGHQPTTKDIVTIVITVNDKTVEGENFRDLSCALIMWGSLCSFPKIRTKQLMSIEISRENL